MYDASTLHAMVDDGVVSFHDRTLASLLLNPSLFAEPATVSGANDYIIAYEGPPTRCFLAAAGLFYMKVASARYLAAMLRRSWGVLTAATRATSHIMRGVGARTETFGGWSPLRMPA